MRRAAASCTSAWDGHNVVAVREVFPLRRWNPTSRRDCGVATEQPSREVDGPNKVGERCVLAITTCVHNVRVVRIGPNRKVDGSLTTRVQALYIAIRLPRLREIHGGPGRPYVIGEAD